MNASSGSGEWPSVRFFRDIDGQGLAANCWACDILLTGSDLHLWRGGCIRLASRLHIGYPCLVEKTAISWHPPQDRLSAVGLSPLFSSTEGQEYPNRFERNSR